ncbi:MAG: polysaccharide deacetylase family protein, partial [Chloroflexi bacterium]|nr:polysaccharide deacetylase family protein [Chloroflexota bacterium]
AILDILRQAGVSATFFVTGLELAAYPEGGQALAAAGHELGNHTYSHHALLGKSLRFIRQEIEGTDALIRAAGQSGPIYIRPPYAKRLLALPFYLQQTGRPAILWDVEPESYPEVAASAEAMVQHVLARARPGSVILLHVMYPGRAETLRAAPGIIQGLQARGYRFVTLSELLAADG